MIFFLLIFFCFDVKGLFILIVGGIIFLFIFKRILIKLVIFVVVSKCFKFDLIELSKGEWLYLLKNIFIEFNLIIFFIGVFVVWYLI